MEPNSKKLSKNLKVFGGRQTNLLLTRRKEKKPQERD